MKTEQNAERIGRYPQFAYDNELRMNTSIQFIEASYARITTDVRFDAFDQSIIDGIFKPNDDFLPNGRYFNDIEDPIKQGVFDIATVADIGIGIGSTICEENPSTKGRIIGYINTLCALDCTKIGLTGIDSPTLTTNGIAEYMRLTITSELPMTKQALTLVEMIDDTLTRASEVYPKEDALSWFAAKAHLLKAAYLRQYNVQSLGAQYSEVLEDGEKSEREVRNMAKSLTMEAMQHRKYGTKPAYIEASVGGSWIFYDGEEWVRTIKHGVSRKSSEQYNNVAAVIFHSPFKKLESLKVGMEHQAGGIAVFTGGLQKAEPDTQLYVTKEGSISLDPAGLQDIAFLGLPEPQKLALQAELSSIFYDLSMPVHKNRKASQNFATLTTAQKESFNPIQDLLIPRVRLIGDAKNEHEQSDVVRTIREHDVAWFVRTLPAGYSASPESREEAARHGIILEENETFVRTHSRGTLQKALGYRAVRRK